MSKILKLPKVIQITGLSRSSVYALIQKQIFPKPIALSTRAVGWLESEIEDWIAKKVKDSRQGGQHASR